MSQGMISMAWFITGSPALRELAYTSLPPQSYCWALSPTHPAIVLVSVGVMYMYACMKSRWFWFGVLSFSCVSLQISNMKSQSLTAFQHPAIWEKGFRNSIPVLSIPLFYIPVRGFCCRILKMSLNDLIFILSSIWLRFEGSLWGLPMQFFVLEIFATMQNFFNSDKERCPLQQPMYITSQ